MATSGANAKKKLNPRDRAKSALRNVGIYLLIGLAALVFFVNVVGGAQDANEVPISQIVGDVKDGKVDTLNVEGDQISAKYKDNKTLTSRKEAGESAYQILESAGVDPKTVRIDIKDTSFKDAWSWVLSSVLSVALIVGAMFLLFRRSGPGQSIFSFGQSRAKVFTKDQPQIKFTDVAGAEESKKELTEIVEFLKTPEKFRALGARTPKGVLLVGPAGVGKTLMARAVAGEAGVPFFSISGSEFMEILVGVGAARVRDLFAQAKKTAPSIIFIDEIESIGRQRGMGGFSGGHDEREQTLNQILVEMDGFNPNDTTIVIAATNRPDLLDAALVRPGRFDRRVTLGYPDLEERKAIIDIHMKGKPFASEVAMERIARRTVGFTGADLANMLNEAAILAAREGKSAIDNRDLEEAATKVKLGPARKRMQTEEDRKLAAYHEAGHAIVGHFLPHIDPVHRITIVARGMSGGHTMFPPTEDRSNESKTRLNEQIATALGGRAAEKMVLNDISTGAASDIEIANNIARSMVTDYGMSDLGPISAGQKATYGWSREDGIAVSPEMQRRIDEEVKKILDEGARMATALLKKNSAKLEKVAKALLEKETLEGDEFEKIVGKKKLNNIP